MNDLSIPFKELQVFFEGFSPTQMLINRVDNSIRLDLSALENITTAILSDN